MVLPPPFRWCGFPSPPLRVRCLASSFSWSCLPFSSSSFGWGWFPEHEKKTPAQRAQRGSTTTRRTGRKAAPPNRGEEQSTTTQIRRRPSSTTQQKRRAKHQHIYLKMNLFNNLIDFCSFSVCFFCVKKTKILTGSSKTLLDKLFTLSNYFINF